jgi:hypothetical protein
MQSDAGCAAACTPSAVRLRVATSRGTLGDHQGWLAVSQHSSLVVSVTTSSTFQLHDGKLLHNAHCISSQKVSLQACDGKDRNVMVDRLSLGLLRLRAGNQWLRMHSRGLYMQRMRPLHNGTCHAACGRPLVFRIEHANGATECACTDAMPPPPPPLPSPSLLREWSDKSRQMPYAGLHVLVLNLRSRPERFARLWHDLRAVGVRKGAIHRVEATDAELLRTDSFWSAVGGGERAKTALSAALDEPSVPTYVIDAAAYASGESPRTRPRSTWRRPSIAEVATTLSHLNALRLGLVATSTRGEGESAHLREDLAEPLFLVLEDDADVSGLAQCWSAQIADLGEADTAVGSLKRFARGAHDAHWEYLQLGSLSPIAYRRGTAAGHGMVTKLAHSWGAAATLWCYQGARRVLERLSDAAAIAEAAHHFVRRSGSSEILPAHATHAMAGIGQGPTMAPRSPVTSGRVEAALLAIRRCGVVADACLYHEKVDEDTTVPPALHGYTAMPPLILPLRPEQADPHQPPAMLSVTRSSIQTANLAANDARDLHAIWDWADRVWCSSASSPNNTRVPARNGFDLIMPLPPSLRTTRPVHLRCLQQPPHATSPSATSVCHTTLSVSTVPHELCGRSPNCRGQQSSPDVSLYDK